MPASESSGSFSVAMDLTDLLPCCLPFREVMNVASQLQSEAELGGTDKYGVPGIW